MKLTKRQTATVLAALRSWQSEIDTNTDGKVCYGEDMSVLDGSGHFADVTPLTPGEIDNLCEKLNFS